jgi:hypothetical protein
MGTIYKCCCSACSHDFTVYDGDGMHSVGLICNGCGKRSSIPRQAPRPPREGRDVPSFLQTSRFYSLPPTPDSEITRFTDEELANMDQLHKTFGSEECDRWDDFEVASLIEKKNPCQCGGVVDLESKTKRTGDPNAMTRCPACRSEQITATNAGAWD